MGKRVHKRRYKCEISFGNASFIVPGSEMDVNVAKDNLSPSPLAASLTSQLHFRRRYWGKDQRKRPRWRRRIFNSFFFSRFYTIFYNSWSGECPLAPGKSGHQEENRRGAKGGEDTSKVLLLLLRPPLLKRPSSTPPTQTTLYDIESAFGTYIIPSLESKLRCQCHKFLILTS